MILTGETEVLGEKSALLQVSQPSFQIERSGFERGIPGWKTGDYLPDPWYDLCFIKRYKEHFSIKFFQISNKKHCFLEGSHATPFFW
jgi:hypothetical protein